MSVATRGARMSVPSPLRVLTAGLAGVLAAVLTTTLSVVAPLPAAVASPGLLASVNAARAQAGLAGLSRQGDLDAVAQAWTQQMAARSSLAHNPRLNDEVSGWSVIAENVGYGPSEDVVQTALMNSPGHRANILDARVTQIGIGVVQGPDRVWVTQVFRRPDGSVASAPAPPAPMVRGAILGKYTDLGGAAGVLGAPLTAELATPLHNGRYNHFRGGSIYWHAATGAWEIRGNIRDYWAARGWETSFLGFPASGENALRGGAFSRFERGSVYWSPAGGTHAVRGAVLGAWASTGYETGRLGYPTTDEWPTPGRTGAFGHFQGGSVYWSPATGAWPVSGGFHGTWSQMGWERSRLGFPVSAERAWGPGARQDFEGGHLVWDRATGRISATYR